MAIYCYVLYIYLKPIESVCPAVFPSVLGGSFAPVGGVCVPSVCLCAVCPFAVLRGLWRFSRSALCGGSVPLPCARGGASGGRLGLVGVRLGQRCRRRWSVCRACSRSFVLFWAVSCICSKYNVPMPFSKLPFFLFKAPST